MHDLQSNTVPLGNSYLRIHPVGTGTWAWGDRMVWGFGDLYHEGDVQKAYIASRNASVNFFDTAEIYGRGISETLLGHFLSAERSTPLHPGQLAPVVATKFAPLPWRFGRKSIINALKSSLKRLKLPAVDLYQIHWPLPIHSIHTWMEGMVEAVESGLIRTVGVSNYSLKQMLLADDVLAKHGLRLSSNQVSYSLLNRSIEHNSILSEAQARDIAIIAYSPLAKGLLTGKYTPENPPPKRIQRSASASSLTNLVPLLDAMRSTGLQHDGKSISQVALNWTLAKGTIPIPGAKNATQAESNAGGSGWQLTATEIRELDQLSEKL